MAKKKITMSIDEAIFEQFKNFCQKNGMKVSSKVELYMKEIGDKDSEAEKHD